MKTLLFALFLLLCSNLALSKSFNGEYIIKLKHNEKARFFGQMRDNSYGDFEDLNVQIGEFLVLKPSRGANLKELAKHPSIEYIEPNYTYYAFDVDGKISDSYFNKQWGLKNTGNNSGGWFSPGVAGMDINAQRAWGVTTGNRELVVAVIDTGVDYTHLDLKDNIWKNEQEINGEEGVDDDGNGYIDDKYGYDFANSDGDPMDDNGHGTHCAGVIGAVHNNKGVRGVMGDVQIMGLKFLTKSGSGESDHAIKAIDYAIKMGVDVLSNSWGGDEASQALKDAIKAAQEQGLVFVAAAGNSSSNNDTRPMYPASYKLDNVISVGSMDGGGKKSSFSNYGKKSVHVFAPGSSIYSTIPGGRYSSMSGTSMAAPFVSGIVGLILANDSGLTALEIRNILIETSVPSSYLGTSVAKGRVDAFRALSE